MCRFHMMSNAQVPTPGDRSPQRPDCLSACQAARLVVTQHVNGPHPCSLTALLARDAVTLGHAVGLLFGFFLTGYLYVCSGIV